MRTPRTKLSIIITAHNEGLLAHKTMLSVERATSYLETNGITYELLISIDKGDSCTTSYFKQYQKKHNKVVVCEWNFGDLSSSRNATIKIAKGNITAFLDADDLISANWFLEGYRIASKDNVVVHQEYSITFGRKNVIWHKQNSSDPNKDRIYFIDNNLWDSPSMARRDIYLKYPYHPNGNGFGYEDKYFNAITLQNNIAHIVAPKTILFVRRKNNGSMLDYSNQTGLTMAPNKLLSFSLIKQLAIPENFYINQLKIRNKRAKDTLLKIAKYLHHQAKRFSTYQKITGAIINSYHKKSEELISDQFPDWLLQEWREIHSLENGLFPSSDILKNIEWWTAKNAAAGLKYVNLIKSLSRKPDTLFFVPQLIKGGADKLFIEYANEISKQHPDWKIVVLQTEDKESVWQKKLSDGIDFVNLFDILQELDYDSKLRLMSTFLAQNKIQRLIIGNSHFGYDLVAKHQPLIKSLNILVYCFAFNEARDNEGRFWGHIHSGLPRIYSVVNKIITDNNYIIKDICDRYAFSVKKFIANYQPTTLKITPPRQNNHSRLKILWASRICRQKRPDILKAISDKLEKSNFLVDVYGQLEEDYTKDFFSDAHIHYKGGFNGIESIKTEDYDVFLYTSENDGIPNVLQEVVARGLPIIAPNVGGIKEIIIPDKTGCLIEDFEDINSYIAAIRQLLNPSFRIKLACQAQELLKERFSKKKWEKTVNRIFK